MPSFGSDPTKPTPRLRIGKEYLHGGRYRLTTRSVPLDATHTMHQYRVQDAITGTRRWFLFRHEAENYIAGACAILGRRPLFERGLP